MVPRCYGLIMIHTNCTRTGLLNLVLQHFQIWDRIQNLKESNILSLTVHECNVSVLLRILFQTIWFGVKTFGVARLEKKRVWSSTGNFTPLIELTMPYSLNKQTTLCTWILNVQRSTSRHIRPSHKKDMAFEENRKFTIARTFSCCIHLL